MPKHQIRRPTLFLRTALFSDGLIADTGLSAEQIEDRVRKNQYERFQVPAPEMETVLDYIALYRSVAFEPRQTDVHAPWLLAAEREFPGCSYRYFHPLVDLLFGAVESSYFWESHFKKIPSGWIEAEEMKGRPHVAEEWRAMNQALEKRIHRRTRSPSAVDQLTFVHLSMLRLPSPIKSRLFLPPEGSSNWIRAYDFQSVDFSFVDEVPPSDGVAVLLGLAIEAAEIGDLNRFRRTRAFLVTYLPKLREDPACRRIHQALSEHIANHLEHLVPREYSRTLYHGFGAPASWRTMMAEPSLYRPVSRNSAINDDDEEEGT